MWGEPSAFPDGDAPCPHCGSLAWFGDRVRVRELSPDLDGLLDDWDVRRPDQLLLDFVGVTRVSAPALGRLLLLHRRVQAAGGRLAACRVGAPVLDLFRITHLDRILELRPG